MVQVCDVVTINCPLHPETEHMFNDALISKMKHGAYIVNTARAKICDRDAIARALESGQLSGYAGDVWFPQPPRWNGQSGFRKDMPRVPFFGSWIGPGRSARVAEADHVEA